MKKIIFFITLIYLFTYFPKINAAECPNAEKVDLGKLATSVKVGYEEATGKHDSSEVDPPDGYDPEEYVAYYNYFIINFLNISDDIYIKLENKDANKEIIINNKNTKDGNYSLNWYNINKVNNFNYTIYASEKTNCKDTVLKSGIISLPAYNPYHVHSKCKGHEDYSICQKYINTNITYNDFIRKIDSYLEKIEKEDEQEEKRQNTFVNSIINFLKDNKFTMLLVIGVVVFVGGFIIGLIIRKKRSRII